MKRWKFSFGLILMLGCFGLFFGGNQPASTAEIENQCIECHTSPKKLIKITREIAKAEQGKSTKAPKSTGEG